MKKTFLYALSLCFTALLFCNMVSAQNPTGVFAKATVAPKVDGVVDDVWANATVYNIDKPYKTDVPTLGTSGQTTWQALWTNDGIYLLVKVTDDTFVPSWSVTPAASDTYNYDKVEVYFDVNAVLNDGFGPGSTAPNNKGHYQVAPTFPLDGTPVVQSDGVSYSYVVTGTNYVAEYFVPFSKLLDKTGVEVNKTATIGFDVTIDDRDTGSTLRKRAVWANTGVVNQSFNTMDACGRVTLEGGDLFVYTNNLTLNTGGTITTDNGTLQMVPTFDPANADKQGIKWSVINGTGIATISSTGVLTAVSNGIVTVKAVTTDGSGKSATTDVLISGQIVVKDEIWSGLNLIKNWNFDTDLTFWSNWVDNAAVSAGQTAPAIVDGVVVMKTVKATDNQSWHYQFNQSPLTAAPNVAYTLKFKSWANVDGTPCTVDFEDPTTSNSARYGSSTDPGNVNGGSEWKYNVNVTPTWFTFHVVFDKMVATTFQKIQWANSLSLATISLDSVILTKDSDMPVFVDNITLNTDGTITTKGGTLQMVATVLPENATAKTVKWTLTPEGIATISPEGLLTAVADGTVTVKAESIDGSMKSVTADVVVSGQKDLFNDYNLIKNWNFNTDLANWGGWVDHDNLAGMVDPVVVDGVVVMKASTSADAWHYQHNQSIIAEANVPYVLKFKSWATADNTPCAVDFEDIKANDFNRYGTTTDTESADLKSEWHYNVNVNPKWFTFHVTFDSMITTTEQKIQWMLSLSNQTISLDSVLLIKESDLNLPVMVAPVSSIVSVDQIVNEGETVTLDGSSSSVPEGSEIIYRWVAPGITTFTTSNEANLTFTAPEVEKNTKFTVSLVVGYGTAKPVYDQVFVTVKQVDKDPTVKAAIQNISVIKGAAKQVIDLKTVFTDPDLLDVVTYAITNTNDQVVVGTIASGKLTLTFNSLNIGTAEVMVSATTNGKVVSSTFTVEVKSATGFNDLANEASVQIYPNPTKGNIDLLFSQTPKVGTMISVYSPSGQEILKTVANGLKVNIDLTGKPAGLYFVKVNQKMFKLIVE